MINLKKIDESIIHHVKVDDKSDIDKISKAFDVALNPSISGEVILDTTLINECEDSVTIAIEVFGEESWNSLPIGFILFHI